MDLNDERLRLLNEQIQTETDPKKLADLAERFTKRLDELRRDETETSDSAA